MSAMHDDGAGGALAPEEEERVGIFPSWRALYVVVIIYNLLLVALLHWFTVALDRSAP